MTKSSNPLNSLIKISKCTAETYFQRVRRYTWLESLNLREGQPGNGFDLCPLFLGMLWTHSALFSFKIWEQTETPMVTAAKIFLKYFKLAHGIYYSLATLRK